MILKYLYLFLGLFSSHAFALPEYLEVWFLSSSQQTSIYKAGSHLYTQDSRQCQSVGEYCFDPQVGLYKKEQAGGLKPVDYEAVDNVNEYEFLDTATSLDRNMIECEKESIFDIFCGKSKGSKKLSEHKLEFWVDTSSTMKQSDQGIRADKCQRRLIAESLNGSCTDGGVKFYSLKEFKKEVSNVAYLCENKGSNNTKYLIRDIKASNAKNLIVVTDVFEAFEEFVSFVEDSGGIIRGLDKPMYANSMKEQLKSLVKKCK